jgi:enoyl-CoA hydratase/carnithine racemase
VDVVVVQPGEEGTAGAVDDLAGVVVVHTSDEGSGAALAERVALLPAVLAGPAALAAAVDLVPESGTDLDALLATVEAQPLAATALALLLRHGDGRTVAEGLLAESAVYSTLQAGPGFAAWRAGHQRRAPSAEEGPAVLCERDGPRLELTLNRPGRRNALSARMREELLDGLGVAALDPTVTEVHLRGRGPSFCSGGDLDEFGTSPDPATAHLVRVGRSAAAAIHGLADRVVAHLHGACVGSGIELPAFAGRVLAAPDTTIALPEVGYGLVPGAGGTVSLPRRIGRHRTALLALCRGSIDASTALAWGLVDEPEG